MKGQRWSREEQDELERRYSQGMRWQDIAASVSAVNGVERTATACKRKAHYMGVIDTNRMAWRRLSSEYDDDIKDLVVLDYTSYEIAQALALQHGRSFSQSWVHKRINKIGTGYCAGWKRRIGDRRSRTTATGWEKRRMA